jgi:hypothetical protein
MKRDSRSASLAGGSLLDEALDSLLHDIRVVAILDVDDEVPWSTNWQLQVVSFNARQSVDCQLEMFHRPAPPHSFKADDELLPVRSLTWRHRYYHPNPVVGLTYFPSPQIQLQAWPCCGGTVLV